MAEYLPVNDNQVVVGHRSMQDIVKDLLHRGPDDSIHLDKQTGTELWSVLPLLWMKRSLDTFLEPI